MQEKPCFRSSCFLGRSRKAGHTSEAFDLEQVKTDVDRRIGQTDFDHYRWQCSGRFRALHKAGIDVLKGQARTLRSGNGGWKFRGNLMQSPFMSWDLEWKPHFQMWHLSLMHYTTGRWSKKMCLKTECSHMRRSTAWICTHKNMHTNYNLSMRKSQREQVLMCLMLSIDTCTSVKNEITFAEVPGTYEKTCSTNTHYLDRAI